MSEPSDSNHRSPRWSQRQLVVVIALAAGMLLVCLTLTLWFMWPDDPDVAGAAGRPDAGPRAAETSPEGAAAKTDEPPAGPSRLPVPDSVALQEALAELQDNWQGKSAAQVIRAAEASSLTSTARYALLVQAMRMAAEAGEIDDALAAVDTLAAEFDVDPLAEKISALRNMGDHIEQPETLRNVASTCLALIDESAADAPRHALEQLAIVSLAAARKAEDQTQATMATYRILKLREQ